MRQKGADPDKPYFIPIEELTEFQRPNRFVPRTLIETPIGGSGRSVPRQLSLDFQIRDQLTNLNAKVRSFKCTYISVRKDDGMSWTAETINSAVNKSLRDFKRWYPSEIAAGALPAISDLVGLNTFYRRAAEHKLTSSSVRSFTFRRWTTPLILVLGLLVGAAVNGINVFQKAKLGSDQSVSQLLTNWLFYAFMIIPTVLAYVSQSLLKRWAASPDLKLTESLAEQLPKQQQLHKTRFRNFVDALARDMRTHYVPRVVIIENYERLDQTTKEVLDCYFRTYSERHTGAESWFFLETTNRDESGYTFRNDAMNSLRTYGYGKTQFFEQLPLNEQEKKELVRLLNKPEHAAEYIAVKPICHDPRDDDAVAAYLLAFHQEHAKRERYETLQFLALLALTADNIFLTRKFILNNLAGDTGLRGHVLTQYMKGKNPSLGHFRAQWTECTKRFKGMLILGGDDESPKLRVIPENAKVLEQLAERLELPDPNLGHLFWSLFWYDKLRNHRLEPMLMRKLAAHLLRADASKVEEEQTYERILASLFDAMLFAADGCMKAGLFTSVPKLLEAAVQLLKGDLPKDSYHEKRQFNLLRKCWDAYSILGDEQILRLILDHDTPAARGDAKAAEDMTRLERLFFDTVSLAPAKRKKLKTDILIRTYGATQARSAVSDYAQVRAAWLALICSHDTHSNVNHFLTALNETDVALTEITQRALARIRDTSEESVRLTDVITLSLVLWCKALRFSPSVTSARIRGAMEALESSEGRDPARVSILLGDISHAHLTRNDFSSLIAVAEDAVLLVIRLKEDSTREPGTSADVDYLMDALAKELCAISIASVLMAASYFRVSAISDEQLKRLNELIRLSNDFLDYTLEEFETLEELSESNLLRQVDSLMKLCGIIWNEFGLDSLRDFINIRRIHFSAVCLEMSADTLQHSVEHSIGDALNQVNFSGIMANLVVSEALTSAEELSAYYLIHAAEIALNDQFGKQLQNELCLAAVLGSHAYGYELGIFLEYLTTVGPDNRSLLHRFLASIPEQNLEGATLRFLNASKKARDAGNSTQILESLAAFAPAIKSDEVRKKIESMLALNMLADKIQKGDVIDSNQVLSEWTDRKDLWLYPWLLELLIQNDQTLPAVEKEAFMVLDQRQPEMDSFNTYFLLSLTLTVRIHNSQTNGQRKVPVNYLKQGIDKWESQLSATTNLTVYKLLYELDPDNQDRYVSKLAKWELIKMEADQLKLLPRLLSSRSFFLIFLYYFESLAFYGLETDLPPAELVRRLDVDAREKQKLATEWKLTGQPIPPPLIRQNGKSLISSEFLILGSYFFSSPNDQDPKFAKERETLDEYSRVRMADFVSVIISLRLLPPSVKELIQNYSARLLSYTLPGE